MTVAKLGSSREHPRANPPRGREERPRPKATNSSTTLPRKPASPSPRTNGTTARSIRGSSSASGTLNPRSPNQRSEEHTSELQSHSDLVCRLLLEKKKPQPH